MTDIATNEPEQLRAGMTWQWRREDLAADYPASGWVLTYWFKKTGATGANFSIVASADGDNFSVDVAIADTQTKTAGDYTWVAVVSDGTNSFEVDRGLLKILPRYDAATNLDDRTHARKMLEAIEAIIENRASSTQREMVAYAIGSRSKTFDAQDTREKLLALHSQYKWLVRNEEDKDRLAAGLPNRRRIAIRMTRP